MLLRFLVLVGANRRRDGLIAVGLFLWAAVLGWIKAPAWLVVLFAVAGTAALVIAFVPKSIFERAKVPDVSKASEDPQEPPVDPELVKKLLRLYDHGTGIRDGLKPSFGVETVASLTEQVRRWDRLVRDLLSEGLPGALPTFTEEPFPEPLLTELPMQAGAAERRWLCEFMDRRLTALKGIIEGASH
ncbi:MAG TPA: hypothetical protein VL972_07475, partial [Solirubrobacteraceae bacterium]|nr:hypothetical protein [Solirubrobacteraceae bacterium]